MARYDEIKARFSELLGRMHEIAPTSAAAIRQSMSGIPDDYVDFLLEVGWGEIGESNYMLYEGPVPGDEITPNLKHVSLFGDDFAGYTNGFDTHEQWVVLEVDPGGDEREVAPNFSTFIRDKLEQIAER